MESIQTRKRREWFTGAVLLVAAGCVSPQAESLSVTTAWQKRDGNIAPGGKSATASPLPRDFSRGQATIALVNGRSIAASQILDLLLCSHGPGILDQLVALYAAEDMAQKKGLAVSETDVDREYESALRRLSNPLPAMASAPFDRNESERLLESVLAERNISREEFFLPVRRNTFLRKVAETDLVISDDDLHAEYDRRFGERVLVRHIQCTSNAEASRIRERLIAGESFPELASRNSANAASAKNGGLLDPFSAIDDNIPENFRKEAFALRPRQISGIVRAGEWSHVLKLEKRIPAEQPDFEIVREQLTRAVRDRQLEKRMRELYEQSLKQAAVEIYDPGLRDAYQRREKRRTPE